MPELLNKSDVMRIINAENAVVLCCTRLRSTDEVLYSIASQINSLQTIQNTIEAEPVRHGRWVKSDVYTFKKCSECGAVWDAALCENIFFIYCPRCGSKNGGADNG